MFSIITVVGRVTEKNISSSTKSKKANLEVEKAKKVRDSTLIVTNRAIKQVENAMALKKKAEL